MVFFPFCGFVYLCCLDRIIRGNQREKDRERAQARSGGKAKKNDDGLTPEQRRERYTCFPYFLGCTCGILHYLNISFLCI